MRSSWGATPPLLVSSAGLAALSLAAALLLGCGGGREPISGDNATVGEDPWVRWKVLEVGKCSTDPSILGYPKEVDCNSQQAQRKLLAKIDTSTGKTCPPDTNRGVMPVGDEMFCFGEP